MAFFDKIDYDKTLSIHKLVLRTRWLDIGDTLIFFLCDIFFIACLFFIFKEVDLSNANEKIIAYGVLPIAALVTLFFSYKKAIEKRLLTISTGLNKIDGRQAVKKIIKSRGWKICTDNANYLQATTGFEFSWGKQVTILFEDDKVYLNVMSDNPMIRMPVLFSDKSIKGEIEKELKAYMEHL